MTAAFAIGALLTGLAVWTFAQRSSSADPPPDVIRFGIHDTDDVIVSRSASDLALSPDGRTLAFVGFDEGGPRIWVRDLDTADARALPGTEGARALGWSPDGRSLVFMASFRIKTVGVAGGTPEVLSPTRLSAARSPVWTSEGTILYSDNNGFWSVAANGGTPVAQAPSLAGERHDATAFLPGGRYFVESVVSADATKAGTWATAFDATTRTRLLPFTTTARYADGHLLFVRDRVLYAQPFDVAALRLSGEPRRLAPNAADGFSVSTRGTVAYRPVSADGSAEATQLEWIDRSGRILERIEQAAGATVPALSPDQRRVAMARNGGVWVLDLARAVLSRISVSGNTPRWSPDGRRLVFYRNWSAPSTPNGRDLMFEMAAGAEGLETSLYTPVGRHAHPTDVSADGVSVIYEEGEGQRPGASDDFDIRVLGLSGDRKVIAVVQTPASETQGTLSRDGRWLAYTSDSSGRAEIYVQSFPDSGPRVQVSPGGGTSARWRRDGNELFYLAPDGTMMGVPVVRRTPIEFGKPAALFQFFTNHNASGAPPYDVTADGQRFIVSAIVRRNDPSLQVLLNWPSLLAKKP